ncbi:putative F-box protein At3g25750 [Carex rostrata]
MDSQQSNPATMVRDWQHLPPELLQVIGKKVISLAVYIRFRAVCRPWQSSCSLRPDHLPVQLPWLMLPYRSVGNNDSTRRFYDLATSKIHELDLPETCGVSICGSSHGWLVLQKGQMLSLLNPITRATISLPPFSGPPTALGIVPLRAINPENFFENWDANEYAINPTDNVRVCKAILTSSAHDSSCRVFVFTYSKWPLAFCKIGDVYWKVIEFHSGYTWGGDFRDITYSNGFLYTVSPFAAVTIYNLDNRSRTLLGGGITRTPIHLVEGVSGDILLIHDSPIYVNRVLKETKHTVYKLSNDRPKPEWIKVIDIGQNVLFLGSHHNVLSLSSANLQFPEWRANCLCYDSIRKKWNPQERFDPWYNHNIKLASLDNGTVTDITADLCPFQVNERWQRSLWLTPSLL